MAGVKRGRGRGILGARERAWSRALIPFPFPFERLPHRLAGGVVKSHIKAMYCSCLKKQLSPFVPPRWGRFAG